MDMLPLWLMANFGAALGLPEKAVGAVKRTLEGLNSIHDRESGLSFFMREYFDYTPDEVRCARWHHCVVQIRAFCLSQLLTWFATVV